MVSLLLNSLYLDEVDWMGRLDGGYEQSRWVLRNALPECMVRRRVASEK